MKKILFWSIIFFLLAACSLKEEDPELLTKILPRTFEAIYFDTSSPYQIQQFVSLQKNGYHCIAEEDLMGKYSCSNITGWYGAYHIPERELSITERTGCWKEDANSWVLYKKRNPAFYLSWDKVFSLSLKSNIMYYPPSKEYFKIRENGKFWTEIPKKIDEQYLSSSFFIQYVPIKKDIMIIIKELFDQWEIFEEVFCDFWNISDPNESLCFEWRKWYNDNWELNGQNMMYIFHPTKDFYYKYYHISGSAQCEWFGFWSIRFFNTLEKTK